MCLSHVNFYPRCLGVHLVVFLNSVFIFLVLGCCGMSCGVAPSWVGHTYTVTCEQGLLLSAEPGGKDLSWESRQLVWEGGRERKS